MSNPYNERELITRMNEPKEWQGLTEYEVLDLYLQYKGLLIGLIFAVEKKLKEKNT